MNTKKIQKLLAIILTITLFSCQSQEEKLEQDIYNTIKTYIEHDIPEGISVDKIEIVSIDTITKLGEALVTYHLLETEGERQQKLSKIKYEQAMVYGELYELDGKKSDIFRSRIKSLYEKMKEHRKNLEQIYAQQDSIISLVESNKLDSINLLRYGVEGKVYATNPDMTQEIIDFYIQVTKNMRVYEQFVEFD